ncbi:M12 family metallopeptidase [Streptomyces sp. Ag109_G2-15]|uniref:M12 family metallopeptidase n=1 Tax=Streptomyces sp. Ag109_G2-15 TaxID=1938850 RepID=UPI000BC6E9F9|nr:M12 family metallopeptidase [Streptomyces sp. Ag109_G2-15]SOE07489.1 Astacin (Peptidase family M12A) [Streptomyces sp. Ag109_G2-15]
MNAPSASGTITPRYCAQPPQTQPVLRPDLSPGRSRAILLVRAKWVNGTVLHYAFLDQGGDIGGPEQLEEVRRAFQAWKNLGIGLEFKEVTDPTESEIRIAFRERDGSASYVGRDNLLIGTNEATMTFGWDLTTPYGKATALHETGHAIGFAHEHQNPFAGIQWNEAKVYEDLGGPPNNWPHEVTFENILRKLSKDEVTGSDWDVHSIMEYSFGPGLIVRPEAYRNGIPETLGLSASDKERVLQWYPPLAAQPARLEAFQSTPLQLATGDQADFEIVPPETRSYEIGTFGNSDVVLALFERVDGELQFVTADDDSGQDRNGRLTVKLVKDHSYVARARLYSTWGSGSIALMYW